MSRVRWRRALAYQVVFGCTLGSTGCAALREWSSDIGLTEPPAVAATAPAEATGVPRLMEFSGASSSESQPTIPPNTQKAEPPFATPIDAPGQPAAASVATPALPPSPHTEALELADALSLAGAENPTIAIARVAVVESQAQLLQARALLLPNLNAGVNYDYHAGVLQSSFGAVRDVDRQALYVGAGSVAIAAGTVAIPGVQLVGSLTDAIFAPRIAGNVVATRQFDASATNNNVLLDVGVGYYALVGAQARLAAVRQTLVDFEKVVRLTAEHAAKGQGRQADADRARSESLLFSQEELRAEEEVAVASARLAQQLNMDPSTRLISRRDPVQLLELVNLDQPLELLIDMALNFRPEMAARAAAIQASQERYRQEQARPFLPTISAGYSAGGFGGGSNLTTSSFGNFGTRSDLDVFAYWTLQDLGFGNLALQRRRRAELQQSEADRVVTMNMIRDEVAESVAAASANRRKLSVAERQLRLAHDGYEHDLQRVRALVGRPIEVLNSARLLASARQEYVLALTRYNQSQLRLFVALGQPPHG